MKFGLFIWCLEDIPIFPLRKNGLDIGSRSKHKQMMWLESLQCCRFSDMLQCSFHHLDLKLNRSSSRHVRTFTLLDPLSRFCTSLRFVHFWWLFMVLVITIPLLVNISITVDYFVLIIIFTAKSEPGNLWEFLLLWQRHIIQCEHVHIACSLGYTCSMGIEEHLG